MKVFKREDGFDTGLEGWATFGQGERRKQGYPLGELHEHIYWKMGMNPSCAHQMVRSPFLRMG